MLLTFMRTAVGLDETVFLKYLLGSDISFQNIDDQSWGNFNATSLKTRIGRTLLRRSLASEMAADIRHRIERNALTRAFIFNGRGFTREVSDALNGLDRVVWLNPDFLPHPEHTHLEKTASTVIFTKPAAYNQIRFGSKLEASTIVNINPVLFATDHDAAAFLTSFLPTPMSARGIDVAFLGNHSTAKAESLNELARLLRRKIVVVGGGWQSNSTIIALGPVYGPHLKGLFSDVKIAIAIPDAANTKIDPITVRYFQYPLLGTLPVLQRTSYNRNILGEELDAFCFENLVEAADRVNTILSMSDVEYEEALHKMASFSVNASPSAESVIRDWVL